MKTLLIGLLFLVISGCSTSRTLGKFTVLSTGNVANLKYDLGSDSGDYSQFCDRKFLFIPIGSDKEPDAKLGTLGSLADNLLDDNKNKGDLLVNVKIKDTKLNVLYLYQSDCIEMHGDVVKAK